MPEEDKTNLRTRDELMAKIAVSMGGRAAEEVIMHTMTNGASQDIQEATNIARNMVAMYGMSDEFGMMALGSVRSQYLDGGYGLDCAQETAAVMDKAVKEILEKCYADAVKVIEENIDDMHKVVAYLLEKETITGGEIDVDGEMIGYKKLPNGELQTLNDKEIARQRAKLGMVFQKFNLFPHMTALENVMEAPVHVLHMQACHQGT